MENTNRPTAAAAKEKIKIDRVIELLHDFEGTAADVIPMLQVCQTRLGYLPQEVLLQIAVLTGQPAAKIFGVATFYAQFRLQPMGRYLVRVCRGTACHVRGSHHICSQLQKRFQIVPGETTPDRRFTLETVACFGSCALAPVMVVDETVYGRMNTAKAIDVLDSLPSTDNSSQRCTSQEEQTDEKISDNMITSLS